MKQIPNQVLCCLRQLQNAGYAAYLVGGCVRDNLLNLIPTDWDICTNAQPRDILRTFTQFKTIPTGIAHGTVTVLVEHIPVEITTFRRDGNYPDHRRPESVTFTQSLTDDLARRDFTMNAMAWSPEEGIIDPYGGRKDLELKCIRCVGEAEIRFTEDALRILRMFRFAARFNFAIDPVSLDAARSCRAYLTQISGERIRMELNQILVSERAADILALMTQTGILQTILPEWAPCVGFDQRTPYHNRTVDQHTLAAIDFAPKDLQVRLALLLHDIAKPSCLQVDQQGIGHFPSHEQKGAQQAEGILDRLRYDRNTVNLTVNLIALHDEKILPDPVALKRLLSRLGKGQLHRLLELRIADTLAKHSEAAGPRLEQLYRARQSLEQLLQTSFPYRLQDLAVSGSDLLRQGLAPGPQVGEALRYLLDYVLEDAGRNTPETLLQEARRWLEDQNTN